VISRFSQLLKNRTAFVQSEKSSQHSQHIISGSYRELDESKFVD